MKIAQISCVYPPRLGGIGRVAFDYAKYLSANHEVTVFTPLYSPEQKVVELPRVKVELVKPKFASGNAAFLPQINALVKDFDIVHLHYPFFGAHELLAFKNTPKLIATYHMIPQPRGIRGWWAGLDSYVAEKKLASKVKIWLVSSGDYADRYVRPRLGDQAHIQVLPFGVGEEFKELAVSTQLDNINLLPEVAVIIFVGGLDQAHYFKGVNILLQAVSKLTHKNWQLLIVGEGDLKSSYIDLAKKLNISSQVLFAGRLSDDDLVKAYNLAQVMVLPSLNEAEAFGIVVLEAMACGLPVIATYLPGLRSLIKTGENGVLVNPGEVVELTEAINFLLSNPELGKKFGNKGKEMVDKNYRWPKIINQLEQIYQAL